MHQDRQNQKIKVAIFSTNDYGGGAARAAYRIHKSILKNGIDSKLIVKSKVLSEERIILFSEIICRNSFSKLIFTYYHKLKNNLKKLRWRKTVILNKRYFSDWGLYSPRKAIQKLNPDLVHLQWISSNYIDMSLLHTIKKPIVWTLHDANAITGGCHIFYDCENFYAGCGNCPAINKSDSKDITHKINRKKFNSFKKANIHVVATCKWMANSVKKSSLLGKSNVSIIPNSIETNFYKPQPIAEANSQLKWELEKYRVMFGAVNATTDKNKGFDLLIDSLQYLPSEVRNNLELTIFGLNTTFDKLKDFEDIISFKGSIPSDELMVNAYNMADLVVVPSRSENLSLVIMESLSCGTPVLAFQIGGNPDMIDHKKNGFLANPFSSKELADGITWGYKNKTNPEISTNARNKVLQNYHPDVIAQQYAKLYSSLI